MYTRIPASTGCGRQVSRVWTVPSRTRAIAELADAFVDERVGRVTMEAISDYWRPFFYFLKSRGVTVWLANARDVKNVPGRPKADELDAVPVDRLNARGMVRPSFVPPAEIPQLRDFFDQRTSAERRNRNYVH